MNEAAVTQSRRAFLRFLAGSPLLGLLKGCGLEEGERGTDPGPSSANELHDMALPDDALSVFDLEAAARKALPRAHFAYIQTGVDGEVTLRENEAAFRRYHLRPRRLVDVSDVDTSVRLFGVEWETPIILAPAASQQAFHPEGELAAARGARNERALQILSTLSSTSVEEVAEARGAPVWFQLYPTGRWDVTLQMLRRAEAAETPVVVLTVDIPAGADNRERLEREIRLDTRDCSECHGPPEEALGGKPMLSGTGLTLEEWSQAGLTWDFVRRLRDETPMRLVLKGIVTAEDAERCLAYGVDGIIVSNHGGRAEESGRAALDSLPEVVAAVDGRIPVLMDSGVRRGTDILKALALGADAICVGRPYLWGLAAFGQPGVERTLELLRTELRVAMEFAGAPSIGAISPSLVGRG